MDKPKSSNFLQSTFIMMLAGVVVKVIGALFSVPLTNIYGAEGTGIFDMAYSIYTAMFTISTAGLPVALSRMVAEANALGRRKEVQKIARVALTAFFFVGLIFSAVMLLGVDAITGFAKMSASRYAIMAIAPSVFFVCIVSAIRGYYQGLSNMVPTAISQVIEALGKLVFGLGLALYLSRQGYSLELVVAGAIGGVSLGTVASALYIIARRMLDLRRRPPVYGVEEDQSCRSGRQILRTLIRLAIPITIGASVLTLTNLVDMFFVVRRLQEGAGVAESYATVLYGAYGMAKKFFTLPPTLIVGVGVSIIPAVAGALARKNRARAVSLAESAFRLTGLLAFPCAVGLAVLPVPIMDLLYYKQPADVLMAGPLLTLLGPSVFFVSMVTVTNAVLQAMGHERAPVGSMAIGGVIKLVTNYILVAIPAVNIYGAPIGTVLCYGVITAINLVKIRQAGIAFSYRRAFIKPLAAAAAMGVFVRLIHPPLAGMVGAKLGIVAAVGLGALFYLLMLVATKALPREDILMLPRGERLAKMLRLR